MSETCRYCGDNPREACYASEREACEYPQYKKIALLAEIKRLRRPLTMQDIRLRAGEGKLSAATVLHAANAILKSRR